MKYLLDTHAVIFAVQEPGRLGVNANALLSDATQELLISTGSIWEIAIKASIQKLQLSMPFGEWITTAINDLGAELISITVEHADRQLSLPFHHRDPFDRLLVAQSIVLGVDIISNDVIFDRYGIQRYW